MPITDDDARAAADFKEMVQQATRDAQVTGEKVSLYQARSGRYALLGGALLFAGLALLAFFSYSVRVNDTLRLGFAFLYLAAAGLFVGLYFWVQRDPLVPLLGGLILYCVLLAPSVMVSGVSLWMLELVILIALIDAIRAARHLRRISKKAAMNQVEATQPVSDETSGFTGGDGI